MRRFARAAVEADRVAILYAVCLLSVLFAAGGGAGAATGGLQGKPAPDFELPDLEGDRLRLHFLRGKVVLLNFWATWCSPCRMEMPAMDALYRAFRKQGLEVIAVSIDTKGKAPVAAFAKELRLSFPIVLDPDLAVMNLFGVRGLPTTFLIGRDGKVVEKAVGPREWNDPASREKIRALLEREDRP